MLIFIAVLVPMPGVWRVSVRAVLRGCCARVVRLTMPGAAVGTLAADLPALRPSELTAALRTAALHDRGFVRDAHGTGTTLLLARVPGDLRPMFGPGSAARHQASGAHELAGQTLSSLRRDVDTADDLEMALRLGVGARTRRLLHEHGLGHSPRAG